MQTLFSIGWSPIFAGRTTEPKLFILEAELHLGGGYIKDFFLGGRSSSSSGIRVTIFLLK
jgi:hypothetical protein